MAFFRQGNIARDILKLENLTLTKVTVSQMIASSLVTFHHHQGQHLGTDAKCEPSRGAEDGGQGDRGGEGGGGHGGGQGGPVQQESG